MNESPLEELLALVTAEAEANDSKKRGADLRVRAALLHWAAHGDAQKALALLEKVDHPLVPSIKLAAALENGDDKLLNLCVSDAKKRNDKADLLDLGGLLCGVQDGADRRRAVRGIAIEGADRAAAGAGRRSLHHSCSDALADGEKDERAVGEALAEAAAVAHDRLADPARARELLLRAFTAR